MLIIGAGITGAMIADGLAASGLNIVIADKRGPAQGLRPQPAQPSCSTRSICRSSSWSAKSARPTPSVPGGGRGSRWTQSPRGFASLDVRDAPRRGLALSRGQSPRSRTNSPASTMARRAAGLASRYLNRKELRARFGLARSAALLSYDNLVINPRQATLALLKAACARKTTIYSPAKIVDIEANSEERDRHLQTNGRRIHCRHLIFATGYELPDHVPRRGHKIISTWAIATVQTTATPVARAVHNLGGFGPLSLPADNDGWTDHLRRRGRGILRRRQKRDALLETKDCNTLAAQARPPDSRRATPRSTSPGPDRSDQAPRACPASARSRKCRTAGSRSATAATARPMPGSRPTSSAARSPAGPMPMPTSTISDSRL